MKLSISSVLLSAVALLCMSAQASPVPQVEPMAAAPATAGSRPSSGYNDFNCKPSAAHPRPVVLVHGTTLTAASWDEMAPKLVKAGYCVYSLTYGKWKNIPIFAGIAPIENNAAEVGAFIEKVLAAAGTTQVDIVGHSQGGILGRYWSDYLGGQGKISRLIGISPITHGTTLSGITVMAKAMGLLGLGNAALDPFAPALMQMVVNSDFMKKLNAKGDTLPNVFQANIVTKYDEIVTPYLTGFQDGAGVVNTVLQNQCALDLHEHIFMPESDVATRWVMNQLDPSTARVNNCLNMVGV